MVLPGHVLCSAARALAHIVGCRCALTGFRPAAAPLRMQGYFDVTLQQAAVQLGVGVTTLKKLCRQNGLCRWPYRARCSLRKLRDKMRVGAGWGWLPGWLAGRLAGRQGHSPISPTPAGVLFVRVPRGARGR